MNFGFPSRNLEEVLRLFWFCSEAIRAVQDAKRKGQLPEFAKHKLQKGKISSKVANDKGQVRFSLSKEMV